MEIIFKKLILSGAAALSIMACNRELPYETVTPIDSPAAVSLIVDGLDGEVALMAPKKKTFVLKAEAKSIADELLTLTVGSNPDLVAKYNEANGTDFAPVPVAAYEFSGKELYLPRYNKVSSVTELTLKSENMPEDGRTYLLPVVISDIKCESTEFDMAPEDYTVYIQFRRKSLPASGYEYGTGTAEDPYQIFTQIELLSMAGALHKGQPTYFKMMENIDLSDYEDWVPVSANIPEEIHFDGNGKTITGFNSSSDSYNSFLGIFTGSFKNVTFENPVLNSGNITATGLVAAKIGNADAPDKKTVVSDVVVKALKINTTSEKGKGDMIGGIAGSAVNAEFVGIDMEVDVIDADSNDKVASNVGGIVGKCEAIPSSFEKCTVKGSLKGHHSTGGILAYASVEGVKIKECSSSAVIKSFGNNTGGVLGYGKPNTEIMDCSATGDVTGGGTFTGGLVGCLNGSTVTHSFSTGNVYSKGHYTGGFIGGGENGGLTVRTSYSTGNVSSAGKNHCGGFIGNMDTKGETGGSLIEDCYAAGNLIAEDSGRMFGGFIGVIEKSNNDVVRRCYAAGNVELVANVVTCGGFIAIAKTGSSGDDAKNLSINFTMEKCIAWNKKVINGNNPTSWSSGAFIGASSALSTLKDNYRRADMELVDYGGVKLTDQSNVSPSASLEGIDPAGFKFAYHGKAAEAGATLTSVAKKLGWPENVWDFSEDMPKLK